MVFLARMLRASRDLSDYKIVLVNDRQDLEEQLGDTATLIGGRVNVIETRAGLRQHLSTDSSDISMVMIHKFQEHKQTLTNTVAEALGNYRAMPAGQDLRRGQHFGPHHPDDRRGRTARKAQTWATTCSRHSPTPRASPSPVRR